MKTTKIGSHGDVYLNGLTEKFSSGKWIYMNVFPLFGVLELKFNTRMKTKTRKYVMLLILLCLPVFFAFSQTKDPSALLQLDSSSQGLLPPRMTTGERNAITNPATGLTIFNTTTNRINFYDGSEWVAALAGAVATIADTDGDTSVQTEESPNEDIIRFDVAGTEMATLDANGLHAVLADDDGSYVVALPTTSTALLRWGKS